MRLPFYIGDIFSGKLRLDEDIIPILSLIEKISPDVIIVAMDPEASGPDTHSRVFQAIAEAPWIVSKKIQKRRYFIEMCGTDFIQRIMAEQYAMLNTCPGREFFYLSGIPRLRATRRPVFLQEMEPEKFFSEQNILNN
ncbi:MAG: hypothetical protein NC907_03460 [Candidatus Omnitrophica bacterium]|nr:hypothetical protein [Candidatus Omnitrophota bacterium]MCM8788829.1 hypothetical protein [Candidatus Omnitrophota bacterium]